MNTSLDLYNLIIVDCRDTSLFIATTTFGWFLHYQY